MSFWNVRTFRVLIGIYVVCGLALLAAYFLGLEPWVRYAVTAIGLLAGAVLMFYPNREVVPQTILGVQWSLILAIVAIFAFLGPLTNEFGFVIGGAVLLVWLLLGLGIAAYGTSLQEREKEPAASKAPADLNRKAGPPTSQRK